MNIKIIGEYSGDTGETSLERLVDRACDGSDYEMGELGELRRTNQKQTKLMARIIEKLNLTNEELNVWFAEWGEKLEKAEQQ
jgi:hypothetical protein